MPYALNVKKGTNMHNADIGDLPGGVAVPINDRQALIAKHLVGVVVFDKVAGINEEKAAKKYYGIEKEVIEKKKQEIKTYKEFMKKYKDPAVAAKHWNEYKKEVNINE